MTARVLTGSKQEIAEKVALLAGDIREAIVFVDEPTTEGASPEDIFAEMKAFTIEQPRAHDSRDAIYQCQVGE